MPSQPQKTRNNKAHIARSLRDIDRNQDKAQQTQHGTTPSQRNQEGSFYVHFVRIADKIAPLRHDISPLAIRKQGLQNRAMNEDKNDSETSNYSFRLPHMQANYVRVIHFL